MRVLEGLEGAATAQSAPFDRQEMETILSGLGKRIFLMHNVHEDHPQVFQVRWALSYLRGPLTRAQIKGLMDPLRTGETAPAPATPTDRDDGRAGRGGARGRDGPHGRPSPAAPPRRAAVLPPPPVRAARGELAALPAGGPRLRAGLFPGRQGGHLLRRAGRAARAALARGGDDRLARGGTRRAHAGGPRGRARRGRPLRGVPPGGGEGEELHGLDQGVRRRPLPRHDAQDPQEPEPRRVVEADRIRGAISASACSRRAGRRATSRSPASAPSTPRSSPRWRRRSAAPSRPSSARPPRRAPRASRA